ncbi:peptidylprolyl isomerase [Candidatus Margulisiibacteriota bacterium]
MYSKKNAIIAILLIACVFTFGFFGGKKKNAVAVVEKEVITKKELDERLAAFPPAFQNQLSSKENKVKILDQMIDELVLYNAAQKAGYGKNDDYKKQIELAQKQILISLLVRDEIDNKIQVTDKDIQDYFTANKAQFNAFPQKRARHILVKTEAEAKQVLRSLKKGSNFAALAKKKSLDTATAKNGGELGWFGKGRLVPEFEKAVFGLKKGKMSGVVKTQFGYHVIKLTDTRTVPARKLSEVKDQIRQVLVSDKRRALMNDLIGKQKKYQKITRDISKIK